MIRFMDSSRPTLPDGEYRVTATHKLTVKGRVELDAARSLSFVVAGPRFALAPAEVVARFPPQGQEGTFATQLAHVLLARPTLPWERSAASDASELKDAPPWLALLVLEETEIKSTAIVMAKELTTADPTKIGATQPPFSPLPTQVGDAPEQPVVVIEIEAVRASEILPRFDELSLLAGVREVNDRDGRVVVIASRLPKPGVRNLVHLVSVESQYRPITPPPATGPTHQHWAQNLTTGTVRLVSLAQWDFRCVDAGGDLEHILNNVTVGDFRLSTTGLGSALGPVQAGAIPVVHRLGTGARDAAWFHGPLAVCDHAVKLALPARQAQDLILTEADTGLDDISYAAAWEIGRLLALANPAVAIPLYQWKRQVAQAASTAQWLASAPEAMTQDPASPVFPLTEWFKTALARLAAVPFAYLVPEPRLLGAETLCLFTIDGNWIAALLDGAFSIGRSSARDLKADAMTRSVLPPIDAHSGILLRSAAVAGWPDLVVDGVCAKGSVAAVRFERLAKDTLFVLFNGPIVSVKVHPHPQALHFGLANLTQEHLAITFRTDTRPQAAGAGRVLDISGLARALKVSHAGELALQMIEAAPLVEYSQARGTLP